LLNLCIDPEYAGQGFGRFLLKEMIRRALERKCMMFFLEVRVSNTHAINLYFSEGFNEVGIRPNYYPAGNGREDAMLMTLDLSVDLYA
jgi:ribosomal-protein-alanine N-acetyltransferase